MKCAAFLLAAALAASPTQAQQAPSRVTFDNLSFRIDGKPTMIWSGEFHPFRLPSPDLWRDILQKMKASGFNTVALYFDWGYHSPKQGVYDFTGIRDLALLWQNFMIDDFVAMWALRWWRRGECLEDRLSDGRQSWLRQRPGDSFSPLWPV